MYESFRTEQHDFYETLNLALSELHEAQNYALLQSENPRFYATCPDATYAKFCELNNSMVSKNFYGLERTTVSCTKCNSESVTWTPFNVLTVQIRKTAFPTLDECFEDYTAPCVVPTWDCPGYGRKVHAKKIMKVEYMPVALIVKFCRWPFFFFCSVLGN